MSIGSRPIQSRMSFHWSALWNPRRIQTHRLVLKGSKAIAGISLITSEQTAILESLDIRKPTTKDRYINL